MRYFGCWFLVLSAFLCGSGCITEVSDMVDHNAPRNSLTGKLEGWGSGGVINPPGTLIPDPKGRKSIHLQAELDQARVFTVQFTTNPTSSADLTGNIPVAIIKFSVNGVTTQRKVSVFDGASISGPGQVCEVSASDETQDPTHSGPYYCGITCTPGTRGGFDIATLQNDLPRLANPGAEIHFFPEPNTGAVLVRFDIGPSNLADTLVPTKYVAQFLDKSGNVLAIVQDPTDWIPIPPGTNEIVVRNNDAVAAELRMVLGIDG